MKWLAWWLPLLVDSGFLCSDSWKSRLCIVAVIVLNVWYYTYDICVNVLAYKLK